MRSLTPLGRTVLVFATVLTGVLAVPIEAQIGNDPGDTTLTDHLAVVSRAPGVPEGSLFAGFENNESVSLFNGNLIVQHPSSPVFPTNGGGSFGLTRVYSSKNVVRERVKEHLCPAPQPNYFIGRSWVGSGWKMHLGRIFQKSVHCEDLDCPNPVTLPEIPARE